jgi:hypothetical protein
MHLGMFFLSLAVSAVAVLGAIMYLSTGLRMRRCDKTSARSRFFVAFVALVLAALVFLGIIAPSVGYGVLCLALTSVYLFDLVQEERARRRRVASLTPRPAAEAAPTVWVAITVASVLMLAPYVVLDEQRTAALMVTTCVLAMAGIAWRVASAPVQLKGEDIQFERARDRASRSRKAGMSAVVALGSVMVFIAFVNVGLPAVLPWQRMLYLVSLVTWAGVWAWVALYWRHLDHLSCSVP